MKNRIYLLLLLLIGFVSYSSAQRIGNWEKLGEKRVTATHIEKDVMRVHTRGDVSHLKFQVDHNPVEFKKVIVRYSNGHSIELKMPRRMEPGHAAKAIKLPRYKKSIKEIIFYYQSVPYSKPNNHNNGHSDRNNRDKGYNNERHGQNNNRRPNSPNNSYKPQPVRYATVSVWGHY